MPVIALTQEMGSLARDVALKLGASLNLNVMGDEVADYLSQQMQVSKSLISRLREGKSGFIERHSIDERRLALLTAEQVYELAKSGNVVLRGWGATCLLRQVPHVVCVRITRSIDKRVEWLMNELRRELEIEFADVDAAREEIRRSDAAHASAMQHRFGVTWGDPLLYDLVLNTDRVSIEGCAKTIAELAAQPEFQETAASRKQIEGLALAAKVRAHVNSACDLDIDVVADGDLVVLRGIVVNDDELACAEKAAAAVAGVGRVENQLRKMGSTSRFPNVSFRP